MAETIPSTDILRLFREDLTVTDRVEAFRLASEQIEQEVNALATPENVAAINDNYSIKIILNSHGDGIDAGQSLRALEDPFMTFVENAGDADISENPLFGISLDNAFDMAYNGAAPFALPYQLTKENAWNYWRDRGLFAKGSIIMPIDIRHYSRRLLDALMGSDYDQQYLSSSINITALRAKAFPDLLEEQRQKGLLVMHSNAVRELTSVKQVLQTLLLTLDPRHSSAGLAPLDADKLLALTTKKRDEETGKLSANIVYGSAHHSVYHVFRKLGINVSRDFPGATDLPGGFKMAGNTKDQFFSAHPFTLPEGSFERYARQHIVESILWCPLDNVTEYGMVLEKDADARFIWLKIARIARDKDLVDRAESLLEEFKKDPLLPVRLLAQKGIRLHHISE